MKPLLLLFLITIIFDAVGQKIPLFETRLYFEDQVGNKDTLTLGFDTAANSIFNADFGETNINLPFDKALDVRAAHRSILDQPGFDGILSKRIITHAEKLEILPDPGFICHTGGNIIIFVKADHYPVKMKWDPLDFEISQECIYQSFITPDYNVEVTDPITAWIQFTGKRFACMRKSNEFSFNLHSNYRSVYFPSEYPYRIVKSFNTPKVDTLYGLSLFFQNELKQSPCMIVVANEFERSESHKWNIYPNPAFESLHFEFDPELDFESIHISNAEGHILKTIRKTAFKGSISLNDFPQGLYQISMINEGQQIKSCRFIKM